MPDAPLTPPLPPVVPPTVVTTITTAVIPPPPVGIWAKFKASFGNSETIVFARLQVLFAAIWGVLTVTDLAPLIQDPKWVTAWLLFSGIVTELLRRSRATDLHQGPHEDEH